MKDQDIGDTGAASVTSERCIRVTVSPEVRGAYTRRMFVAETRLYLRSPTRLAFLTRRVEFSFPPRVGEFVKLRNAEHGNYFAIRIAELTHVESEGVDLMLESLDVVEEELDEYVASYQAEGWLLKSNKARRDAQLTRDTEDGAT